MAKKKKKNSKSKTKANLITAQRQNKVQPLFMLSWNNCCSPQWSFSHRSRS